MCRAASMIRLCLRMICATLLKVVDECSSSTSSVMDETLAREGPMFVTKRWVCCTMASSGSFVAAVPVELPVMHGQWSRKWAWTVRKRIQILSAEALLCAHVGSSAGMSISERC